MKEEENIIIYTSKDGKASVSLFAQDGQVWMTQSQLAELFATSKQNVGQHVASILDDNELEENSVVKKYFTTAAEGKKYEVAHFLNLRGWKKKLKGEVLGIIRNFKFLILN